MQNPIFTWQTVVVVLAFMFLFKPITRAILKRLPVQPPKPPDLPKDDQL